jgi:hypothetical protein
LVCSHFCHPSGALSLVGVYPQLNGWGISMLYPYLIVSDPYTSHGVYAIDSRAARLVTRVAGRTGKPGTADGPYAAFANPLGVAVAPASPLAMGGSGIGVAVGAPGASSLTLSEAVFVSDKGNSKIRRVDWLVTIATVQNNEAAAALQAGAAPAPASIPAKPKAEVKDQKQSSG